MARCLEAQETQAERPASRRMEGGSWEEKDKPKPGPVCPFAGQPACWGLLRTPDVLGTRPNCPDRSQATAGVATARWPQRGEDQGARPALPWAPKPNTGSRALLAQAAPTAPPDIPRRRPLTSQLSELRRPEPTCRAEQQAGAARVDTTYVLTAPPPGPALAPKHQEETGARAAPPTARRTLVLRFLFRAQRAKPGLI